MKLRFLGTGGGEGWPGIFCNCEVCLAAARLGGKNIRLRPGAVLEDDILLDYSPDLYAARLRFGVDLAGARDILVTHADADHFVPEHLEFYPYGPSVIKKGEGATFYGNARVKARFDAFMATPAGKRCEGYAQFKFVGPFDSVRIRDIEVTALVGNHGSPGACNLYLIKRGSSTLLYAHDTGLLPESTWERLKGERLAAISMDASYGPRPSLVTGHMSFADNIATRERMLREGIIGEDAQFALSHFLHAGGMLHDDMARAMEDKGFIIAYDGLALNF